MAEAESSTPPVTFEVIVPLQSLPRGDGEMGRYGRLGDGDVWGEMGDMKMERLGCMEIHRGVWGDIGRHGEDIRLVH